MVREGLEQVGREPLLGFDKAVPDAGPGLQRATAEFNKGMDIDGSINEQLGLFVSLESVNLDSKQPSVREPVVKPSTFLHNKRCSAFCYKSHRGTSTTSSTWHG